MSKDYFKGYGSHGPDGNFAQLRKWPKIGEIVLYGGHIKKAVPVTIIRISKGDCSSEISGYSEKPFNIMVGLTWLRPMADCSSLRIAQKFQPPTSLNRNKLNVIFSTGLSTISVENKKIIYN